MSEDPSIDVMEATMRRTECALADEVARAIFRIPDGPVPYVPPPSRLTRLRLWLGWKWLAMREWLAVHVLRVELARDQEDW